MDNAYIVDKTFSKLDFEEDPIPHGDYEECEFVNCNFAGADLGKFVFIDCNFNGCNLAMAKTAGTSFRNNNFTDCKLTGVQFSECDPFLFAVNFEKCILNLASFYKQKMKNARFSNCSMNEVDFTQTDLTGATLHNCDLAKAVFDQSNIEKADLRSSFNYSIDPTINRVKKARFSMPGAVGLLDHLDVRIE